MTGEPSTMPPIRISMWSGPRNISTAMMRSFGSRADAEVVDEPFYAHWLATSHADHPYREETLEAYPVRFDDVVAWLEEPATPPARIRFFKHIAFHIEDDAPLSFLDSHRSFCLIRDPSRMAASYSRKFEDLTPIVRSYRVARRIAARCADAGRPCPVVAAEDILADPARMLTLLCEALEIPFDHTMLRWRPGPRASDGPWGPHGYDAVYASTGFSASDGASEPMAITQEEKAAVDACKDDYDWLHSQRLVR